MTPFTMPIPSFKQYSGLGESKIRDLDEAGEIQSVVAGGRRLIIVQSWHDYIERQKATPNPDARRNKAGAIPPRGRRNHLLKD